MNVWIRRTLQVGLLSAGLVVAGAVAAQADDGLTSTDNVGTGNANQVVFPVQLPTNVCGNALAAAGDADAMCEGSAVAKGEGLNDVAMWSEDNIGLGVANQVVGTVQGATDISGNAAAAAGDATATSEGGSTTQLKRAATDSHPTFVSDGNVGLGVGNQVAAPVQAPVDISGNAAAAAGDADAWSEGGAYAKSTHSAYPDLTSEDNVGLGNGNQAVVPVQTPVDISGNAAAAAGDAIATSDGGSEATLKRAPGSGGGLVDEMVSDGNVGVGNGNQVVAPIQLPINICGNAIDGLGGDAEASCEGGATAKLKDNGDGATMTSEDNVGLGNGNQVIAPIQIPVNICGNAVSALGGDSEASCDGGSTAKLKSSSLPVLSSTDNVGVGVGNQLWIPIQAPIEISGNALAVAGDAIASSEGGATAIQI